MTQPERRSRPVLRLAWIPAFAGMTLRVTQRSSTFSNVMPAQASIHASLAESAEAEFIRNAMRILTSRAIRTPVR